MLYFYYISSNILQCGSNGKGENQENGHRHEYEKGHKHGPHSHGKGHVHHGNVRVVNFTDSHHPGKSIIIFLEAIYVTN